MIPRGAKKLTPVMRQYQEAKNGHPDAILFFRLGDFYEMFHDDAVVAARELGLTLTSRNKGAPDEVPMAGVPHHAAHNYVARLIQAGHKVAICDQLGDPSKIKGIVPRKVVRVVTAGLLTDADQLDERQNNYLVGVDGEQDDDAFGLARLDLSTGELTATEVSGPALLLAELARVEPREVLLADGLSSLLAPLQTALPRAQLRQDPPLGPGPLAEQLDRGVAAPLHDDAVGHHTTRALRAAARALRFARVNLPDTELPVRRIGSHDPDDHLRIDETAQRHLELVRGSDGSRKGSLLDTIDATITAGGARRLRRQLLAPALDVQLIRRRLDGVERFVSHPRARHELREALRGVADLERLTTRATLGEATPRDLGAIRDSLGAAPVAWAAICSMPRPVDASAAPTPQTATRDIEPTLEGSVDLLPALAAHLAGALVDQPPAQAREGGFFRDGHDRELDELGAVRRDGTQLLAELESTLREQTGIGTLKIKFNRVFGWYIEVTKPHVDKVPDTWRRKQTLATAERYSNEQLDELADRVLHAEDRYREREASLFRELVSSVAAEAEGLRRLATAIASWDVSSALAEVAQRHDYARPDVDDGDGLTLIDGRHPVVEQHVAAGRFVPNDITLDLEAERFWLVTGPNMAGKSTLMRQVALSTILAQMGSFVPAGQAHIGMVDRILSRVGASDDLSRGESTFMVEMRETATILRDATRRSLVILDEIGRGTSTFDGLAIAWAVAEYLHEHVGCRAMFATHYHQLTELASHHQGIANYSVSAREHEGDIVFLHRVMPGSVSRSYGVAVARLAGLPETVLARAGALLAALEEGRGPTPSEPDAALQGPKATRDPQLDLFRPSAPTPAPPHPACETLRHLEVNRVTPLEALQLLAKLKEMVGDGDDDSS